MPKKLGLALGSGGVRGVAHVGFLMALDEAGIHADFVTGCSMGAIVGALYCAGVSVPTMKEKVLKLKLSQIATLNVARIYAKGLFRLNKARVLMQSLMGDKTFDDLKIPFACVATDLVGGKLHVLKEGDVITAAIASSSIPGIFEPVELDGCLFVDGGLLERVPTRELKKMGAEVVVAVDVLGDLMQKKIAGNIVDNLLRCIDIVDTCSTQRKKAARSKSVDLWLEPELGAMDQYRVTKKNIETAYQTGYELGKANAEKIKRLMKD